MTVLIERDGCFSREKLICVHKIESAPADRLIRIYSAMHSEPYVVEKGRVLTMEIIP